MNSTYAPIALVAVVLAMAVYGATRDREGVSSMQAPGRTAAAGGDTQMAVPRFPGPIPADSGATSSGAPSSSPAGALGNPGEKGAAGNVRMAKPDSAPEPSTGTADRSSKTDTGTASRSPKTDEEGPIREAWKEVKQGVEEIGDAASDFFTGEDQGQQEGGGSNAATQGNATRSRQTHSSGP